MQKVVVPICAMKGGFDLQQYVDLLVPSKAKFSLLQGEGPINLLGRHCVDFFGYRDMDADSEEGKEKGDKKTPTKQDNESKKRKASEDPKSAEKKKKESPAK